MKNRFRIFLLVIVALFMQFDVLAMGKQAINEHQTIVPDSRLQAEFNRIASAEKEDKALLNEISKLKGIVEDVEHLLQQVVYFRANAKQMYFKKEITSIQMDQVTGISYLILKEFLNFDENSGRLSSTSSHTIINAVVPYLGTKDPELKKQLHWLLNLIDYRGIKKVDYGEYESYIRKMKDDPPLTLIQYMYQKLPGEALLALMRIYIEEPEAREFFARAEEVVDSDIRKRYYGLLESRSKIGLEAKEALSKLSKYEQWWIHLYVAEIMYHNPEFRSQEILERLKKDEHPLVSEVLDRFQR